MTHADSLTARPHSPGLRSHLIHLFPLPRHALFHVHLTIHQLSSLPLVSGDFAIKWKFRNVSNPGHSKPGRGRGRGKQSSKDDDPSLVTPVSKGKGKVVDNGIEADWPASSHPSSMASSVSTGFPSIESTSDAEGSSVDYQSEERGITPFVKLRDYNVKWEQSIDAAVQMTVQKDTGDLLPSELKLVVLQHVVHGDPDAPHKPRTGAVYLNLAEYADLGDVTRNYLLRESKTNATLKLTLNVRYISGERSYKPPPLRKGEIMAGVSGLLSSMLSEFEDMHPKLPGTPHAVFPGEGIIPFNEDWSFHPIRPPLGRARGTAHSTPTTPKQRPISMEGVHITDTARIIETIFNPFASPSPAPNPFTYYVPPKANHKTEHMLTVPLIDEPSVPSLTTQRTGTQEQLKVAEARSDALRRASRERAAVADTQSDRTETDSVRSSPPSTLKSTGWLKRLISSSATSSPTPSLPSSVENLSIPMAKGAAQPRSRPVSPEPRARTISTSSIHRLRKRHAMNSDDTIRMPKAR